MGKKRLIYGMLFLALLVAEVCIALFVHDGFIRPYLGDVLVTVLICAFFRVFIPEKGRLLPLYVFFFAAAVEVGQYFDMVRILGLADNRLIAVMLGSTFSVYDLLCYGVGCAIFGGISYLINHNSFFETSKS